MPASSRRITIADVARLAEVSKAQAGRALGGYGSVSPEVMTKVMNAAENLGYRVNRLARSMSTGLTHTIGVIVGDIENPNFSIAIRGITDAARDGGYRVVLANSDERIEEEQQASRVMIESCVDGVIVAPCSEEESNHLSEIIESGRKLMLFDRSVQGIDMEAIKADFSFATIEAINRSFNLGHRRIAYLSSRNFHKPIYEKGDLRDCPVGQRIDGIISAYEQNGFDLDMFSVHFSVLGREAVSRCLDQLLNDPRPPTALVASDALIAQNVLVELKQRGVKLPQEMSVMMYDDFAWTEFMTPSMTVIAQPVYEMGFEVGRRMVATLAGHSLTKAPDYIATLEWRESVVQAPFQ